MSGITTNSLFTTYTPIKYCELYADMRIAFKDILCKEKSITAYIGSLGLSDSTLSNSTRNYLSHSDEVNSVYDVSGVKKVGLLRIDFYTLILNGFNLEDKYTLPRLSNTDVNTVEDSRTSATDSSNIVSVTYDFSKIEESLEQLNKTMADISLALLAISDCFKKPNK